MSPPSCTNLLAVAESIITVFLATTTHKNKVALPYGAVDGQLRQQWSALNNAFVLLFSQVSPHRGL